MAQYTRRRKIGSVTYTDRLSGPTTFSTTSGNKQYRQTLSTRADGRRQITTTQRNGDFVKVTRKVLDKKQKQKALPKPKKIKNHSSPASKPTKFNNSFSKTRKARNTYIRTRRIRIKAKDITTKQIVFFIVAWIIILVVLK